MKLIFAILVHEIVYVQGKRYLVEVEGNNTFQEEHLDNSSDYIQGSLVFSLDYLLQIIWDMGNMT